MNSLILYRVVGVVMGHTFKAVWEIFSLCPVSVPLGLYLPTHLEIIGKPQWLLHQRSSLFPPLLSFAIVHSASDQVGSSVPSLSSDFELTPLFPFFICKESTTKHC